MPEKDSFISVDSGFFAGLTQTTFFSLVRHGKSEGNEAGIFQGHSEYPLTDEGRAQAMEAGRSLSDRTGALVFCSPLSRARETAEIIARTAGFKPPRVDDVLMELDTGSFTGRSWDEKQKEHSKEWVEFRSRSWEAVEGAEREAALYQRAVRAWTLLRDTAIQEKKSELVVVTHGGFLQWLVRSTFGSRTWFPLIPIKNCCVYRLKVDPVTSERAALFWETMG